MFNKHFEKEINIYIFRLYKHETICQTNYIYIKFTGLLINHIWYEIVHNNSEEWINRVALTEYPVNF